MNKIKTFFWICSGVHIPLLKKCEVESSKYAGIGATIFFTGLFAAFAAGYALYTVFDNWWIAAMLGLVWGLMIFNLDRFIVSSMRKAGGFPSEARTAIPRIILAIIISIVIVKPLELKIFEKEILAELVIMEQQTYAAQEAGINARYQAQQLALDDEIALLKREIDDKTSKRDALDRLAQITDGAERETALPRLGLVVGGNDDHGRRAVELQELLLQLDTRHDGHLQVEHHAVRYRLGQRSEECRGRAERLCSIVREAQQPQQGAANRRLVVDDRDQWQCRVHWSISHFPACRGMRPSGTIRPDWLNYFAPRTNVDRNR